MELMKNEEFIEKEIKKFNVSDAAIAKLKEDYLTKEVAGVDDIENYLICKEAHQEVKKLRVSIDKKRKELKESSLKFGRAVDGEAKRLTKEVLEVEEHLMSQRKIVEDEKDRIKREREKAERLEQERIKKEEERLEKIRLEQEETARKQREAQEKIDAEKRAIEEEKRQIAENKRVEEAKEQARIAAEKKAKKEAEEAKIRAEEEQQQAVDDEKRKAEEERQRVIREQEAKEQQRIEEEKEKERQEALKPDIEKLSDYADRLLAIECLNVTSEDAQEVFTDAKCLLFKVANILKNTLK